MSQAEGAITIEHICELPPLYLISFTPELNDECKRIIFEDLSDLQTESTMFKYLGREAVAYVVQTAGKSDDAFTFRSKAKLTGFYKKRGPRANYPNIVVVGRPITKKASNLTIEQQEIFCLNAKPE